MKISVAMCTYNGEKFIQEQIDSILNQTQKVDEIVVCDDGSTDGTIQILNNYGKKYPNLFKIYINEVNLRSVKNFEKAISLCTGEVIFLSDQDDVWVANKVEKHIEYFNQNSTINVLASNGFCIDENSKVHEKYSIWDVPQFLRENNIYFNYFELIAYISNISTGASMAFRSKILPEILPFPIIKGFHHDEWIALISSRNNSFELLNEKHFYYRIHNNQQVGSTFFDKNGKVYKKLLQIYDINNYDISFQNLKRRLRKMKSNEYKNSLIANDENYNLHKTKLQMEIKKKYPFFYNLLKKLT